MTNLKQLCVTYANADDLSDTKIVNYRLRPSAVTLKWVERVLLAQRLGYQIDDPARFYGFGALEQQISQALTTINDLIDKLELDNRLSSVHDQDTLNRLHHVFEIEHGLLDVKDTNPERKQNLCNLNLLIHRCESIARGAHPRHVVTYFGLPKTQVLDADDYEYFDHKINFGTVYINYAEIGKTLTDLMFDNDSYIDATAFQPFRHYSADFVVKFWQDENSNLQNQLHQYYLKNQIFFQQLGYNWQDLNKSIGAIPVADLDYPGDILTDLEYRQFVKAVQFF